MATAYNVFLNLATANTIRATNQWEITASSGDPEIDAVLKEGVTFVQGFVIPKRTVNYANVSYKGYEATNLVPTNIDMTKDFAFDVIDDMNGSLRRAFMKWQNNVMNFAIEDGSVFEGDRGVNPKSLIRLQLFDKDNKTVIQTYKFYNVHIKEVGEVNLDYGSGDVSKFNVQAVCTYWEFEENKKGSIMNLK